MVGLLRRGDLLASSICVLVSLIVILLKLTWGGSWSGSDSMRVVRRIETLLRKFHVLGIGLAGKSELRVCRRRFGLLVKHAYVFLPLSKRVPQQGGCIRDCLRDDSLIGFAAIS